MAIHRPLHTGQPARDRCKYTILEVLGPPPGPDSQLVDHNGALDRLGVFFVTPRIASSKAYRQQTVIFVTNERINGQGNSREDM